LGNRLILEERIDDQLALITINRPERRNALSIELMRELCDAFERNASDAQMRCIVLRGAGPLFCAGLDLNEGSQQELIHLSAEWVARTFETIALCPLVTIAAARGAAIAEGAGLLAACDLTVVADDLHLHYSQTQQGLVPALNLTLLYRQVSDRDARELLLLAKPIDAKRAQEMKLITRIAPANEVDQIALDMARQVMQNAPGATMRTKMLMRELSRHHLSEDLKLVLAYHLQARTSEEAQEGVSAFLEKRDPRWD
jgi:methylglutaconyl-CoA hydratase